jgi:hypothetical protein
MLEITEKSLGDLKEDVRKLFSYEDGKLMLDIDNIRTTADVQAMKDAKDREVTQHNAVKTELAAWKGLGKTAEELKTILAEYPVLKEKNVSAADFASMKSDKEKAEKALAEMNDTRKKDLAEIEELKKFRISAKVHEAWKPIRKELEKTYEPEAIDILFEDNKDKFTLNESLTEFVTIQDKSVKDFVEARLKAFNAVRKNTPSSDINLKNHPQKNLDDGGLSLIDESIKKQLS